MAKTLSTMLELGTKAPDFKLPDTSNKIIALQDLHVENGLLVMFICNHCPYVIHVNDELKKLTDEYMEKGIAVVAINSNDVNNYPDDSPDKMKLEKEKNGFQFHYLFDESQEIAKAYKAACTPDFFLFNKELNLVYRGQLDDSRPGSGKPVTGYDLRTALENLLANQKVSEIQIPSMGCNIKWKSGNEPSYF